jgi:hypothetical protein
VWKARSSTVVNQNIKEPIMSILIEMLKDPNFGDKLVGYVCIFGFGFIVGMISFGG